VLFLACGLLLTGHAILTPLLMVLIMITGDFLGMSLTTDNVRPSATPNAWRIGSLTLGGVLVGVGALVYCLGILTFGLYALGYDAATLQTLSFVAVVFSKEASTYTNRERRRLWSSRPGAWLVASSIADLAIAATLAIAGLAMAPLSAAMVVGALVAATVFAVALDLVKVPLFRRLRIA
jgi:H+-transporting ATPase